MAKVAAIYQQKYEKLMGESSEDELWSDIEREIVEFKKKVELGKADGYFWNMYFNLLRSNRLMFAGINKAFITGDMTHMLNGIYQENRFNCIYRNRANSGGAQTINFIDSVLAYSCNDYNLLGKIMPFEAGSAICGYSAPYYNMVYAMTYHADEVGKKAQAELSIFMEKKQTMPERIIVKINENDNVAVAIHDLPAGAEFLPGLKTREPIPQAHKIALTDIPKGGEIIRYGVVLGYAKKEIPTGSWINEFMLDLPESPKLDNLPYGTNLKPMEALPMPERTTWMGYRNKVGPAGTRNLLGIVTTVQCAAGVLKVAVERIRKELLPKYPHVDGVVAVTHPYGCGVAINAPEAKVPIRAVTNLIRHPNFGGEIMVVGLGCEKLTYDRVLPPEDITPENVLTLQDYAGHDAMMQAILDMADKKLQKLEQRRREELPVSELLIGMQCGGSDAFSGITANPSAGYAADMIVRCGGTVMFSEVTEVRDGVQLLAARCVDAHVRDRLAEEMKWYDDYLAAGGVGRDANPTPGNKAGGLANIVEKAMGSIAKSGTSPIVEVLSPAEKPTKHGLIYAATPASDIVCGPSQVASGIGLQVFMTGRGTPYGLDVSPVIKVCSRNEMKKHWFDLIDISAGEVATGEKTIAEVGTEIYNFILDVASGTKQPYSDQYGFHNDMCIFNPAPIT